MNSKVHQVLQSGLTGMEALDLAVLMIAPSTLPKMDRVAILPGTKAAPVIVGRLMIGKTFAASYIFFAFRSVQKIPDTLVSTALFRYVLLVYSQIIRAPVGIMMREIMRTQSRLIADDPWKYYRAFS